MSQELKPMPVSVLRNIISQHFENAEMVGDDVTMLRAIENWHNQQLARTHQPEAAQQPAQVVPEGFDVQALTATGGGHKYPLIVVRDKASQLGEDVFEDEHPVIYGMLSALLAASQHGGRAE